MLGNSSTLARSTPWAALLEYARDKRCLYLAATPFKSLLSASLDELLAQPRYKSRSNGARHDLRKKVQDSQHLLEHQFARIDSSKERQSSDQVPKQKRVKRVLMEDAETSHIRR